MKPFVVSLSNHERPFDRLRANEVFLDTLLAPRSVLAVGIHKREDFEGHPLERRLDETEANVLLSDQDFRPRARHDIDGRYYLIVAKR